MLFFLILGSFLNSSAYAIVGEGVQTPDPAAYPFACRVNVFYNTGTGNGSCSATIIDETHVQTAGHCFRPNLKFGRDYTFAVSCSNEFLPEAEKVLLPKVVPGSIDVNTGKWLLPVLEDNAIIQFRAKLNRPFLKRAIDPNLYFDSNGWIREKERVSCWILGYGTNDIHTISGKLQMVNLDQTNIRWIENEGIKLFSKNYYLPVSAEEGDSGGSLMCQAPGHEPELVGVTSQVGKETEDSRKYVANYFSPTWLGDEYLF